MAAASENPPPFAPHVVELESIEDGKITNVAVYSGRAEVTRLFRFAVKEGQNQIHISGLPNVMDQDSLRVEGRGAGTIQEVSVAYIESTTKPTTSPKLKELLREKEILEQDSYRATQTLKALEAYIKTLVSSSTPSSKLKEVLADYNANTKEVQIEAMSINDKIEAVEEALKGERAKLEGKKRDAKLNMKASVGIFVEKAGDVEIALVYAVMDASWQAKYDIRVDTQTKEKTVALVYKGSITQNTGEDWSDVTLVLETATPTFDKSVPQLWPWTISVDRGLPPPQPVMLKSSSFARTLAFSPPPPGAMAMAAAPLPEMDVRRAEVSSNSGSVSATFTVPGKMTIPSDNASHSVTITQLNLEAKMTWVSVPKKDTKVHLSAKIKNSSEFLLLDGPASVYVDGSFISRSFVPSVSPDESFDCPLGLDPAIKVTYHPQTKKVSKSGLINKSDVYLFTQRITVHNTKNIDVETVKVIDQIHVSEDATIAVKLISPALQLPSVENGSVKSGKGNRASITESGSGTVRIPAPVKVASGVTAKWDDGGEDEESVDAASLGKDGKLNFICSLPPQGKTNLTLQWEVSAPVKTKISGL
ncbi:mucoidy inhibitor A [Coprinopsis cinerea okayama7|uniref:Mucoidy inhibitor A n=1 Tax=Coprinopsis cinerea (strain Okayama-7 / 130 / ATCC MYA-4618 / FGSC 9003) TaxID=240176 RepID=A8PEU6_COPC7|nr:mucoidy inhibitor A [Coprinopsis cinerea okayama7\|eukprot:XP_001840848.1 mucoidy inhibitor A [Coprinopsis cinerea okayama7\